MTANNSFWDKQYTIKKDVWQSWFLSSLRLREASLLLWKKIQKVENKMIKDKPLTKGDFEALDLFPVFMMLSGLSIEVIFKSFLVKNGKEWKNISHKILEQIIKEKIELTEEEKKLEERLIKFVSWEGKYPIPMKLKDYRRSPVSMNNSLIDSIYSKVKKKLNVA